MASRISAVVRRLVTPPATPAIAPAEPHQQVRVVATWAIVAAVAFTFLRFANGAYPISDWLFLTLIRIWAWHLLLALACASFGGFAVQRLLRVRPGSPLQHLSLSVGLGCLTFGLGMFAAGALVATAEEKKEKPLTGVFKRSAEGHDLKLEFKKDNVFVFHVKLGDAGCVMTSKYTKEKDGTYKCEVTNFEKKGDFPVEKPKGYKFSFKLETKDNKVVMSDLTGDDIDEQPKKIVEGEYEKATD